MTNSRFDPSNSSPTGLSLSVSGLSHSYGGRDRITVGDWDMQAGAMHLLSGPSGSGKTTLLSIITGLLRPSEGDVFLGGQSLWQRSVRARDAIRSRQFGIVFQDHHLISSLTLFDNMAMARALAGLPPDPAWADQLLQLLGIAEKKGAKPGQLSRGQAQRAALARAAATRPAFLMADEPTSALDRPNAERVITLLSALRDTVGSTILVASHDDRIAAAFSRGLRLENGGAQAWS